MQGVGRPCLNTSRQHVYIKPTWFTISSPQNLKFSLILPKIKKIIAIFTLLNVKIPLKERSDVEKVAIYIRLMIIERTHK